jgi:hypothetical protein
MSFGNVIEQILQQGMAGQSRARLEHSVGPEGLGGVPGLGELLGSVLGGQAGGRSGGGGLGEILGGGPSGRASAGGLGELLGSLLGGRRGALRAVAPADWTTCSAVDPAAAERSVPAATLWGVAAWRFWPRSRWWRSRT